MLEITPIMKREAYTLIERWERYNVQFNRPLFALACSDGAEIVGVAVTGLPAAFAFNDGWTTELQIFAKTKEAERALTGAAWRAARAIGYRRMVSMDENMVYAEEYTQMCRRPDVSMPGKQGRKMHWDSAMRGYRR